MQLELKPVWSKLFSFNWKFGLVLLLIVCIPRFALVLQANATANYGSLGLVMIISAVAPFIFLSKYGRVRIGIERPKNYRWVIIAFVVGLACSIIIYLLGEIFYGISYDNWYYYIRSSYSIPEQIDEQSKLILFGVMALTGMTFSPIGEELFFRGIVHSSFANSVGNKRASIIDSSAFALVHISHFGLVFVDQQWKFLPGPTIIWVLSMFIVSILFYISRKHSGSILGAILCHAGFNLGMIYCIFYLLDQNHTIG